MSSEEATRAQRAQSQSQSSVSSFGSFGSDDGDAQHAAAMQHQQRMSPTAASSASSSASHLTVKRFSISNKVAPTPAAATNAPSPHSPQLKAAAPRSLSVTTTSPRAAHRPRPSVVVPQQPPESFLSPSTVYTPLFSPHGPKSPPLLRKKHSELALRLGDVMGEIHKHEKEKRDLHSQLTHRHHPLLQDQPHDPPAERRLSASVADWKPYDHAKERRAQQHTAATKQRGSSVQPVVAAGGVTGEGGVSSVALLGSTHKRSPSTLPLVLTTSNTASARVQQSASVIRVTRFARILRVIRLVRIVRLFRLNSPLSGSKHPSKVGLHLSELIDKRTILMMLGLVIILPFLTGDPAPDDQSPALGLEVLVDSVRASDFSALANVYLSAQSDLIYVFINTSTAAQAGQQVLLDRRAEMSWLRVSELNIYSDGTSQAMFSIRDSVYLTSCYSMATTSLIIAVFAIGSYVITRNVHSLVVAPLERMTQIIRKLAGTVCFLSAATEDESRQMTDGLETNMIETTIEKMANIFAVQPDGNSALPKPLQMMAGSKHTEILTNSSVVSIEVTERPKGIQEQPVVDDGSVSDDRSQWREIDTAVHRELSTIDEIVSHPLVIPYFDLYLSSCFVSENLHFCLEVDRFRSIIRTHALHLYNSFISGRAHNAINTSSDQREAIASQLSEPTAALFDNAQRECLHLMGGHWSTFLRSRWCRGYVRKAEEQERRRARMVDRKGGLKGGKGGKAQGGELAEPLLAGGDGGGGGGAGVDGVVEANRSGSVDGDLVSGRGVGSVEAGELTSVEVLHSERAGGAEEDAKDDEEINTLGAELLGPGSGRIRSSSEGSSMSAVRSTTILQDYPGAVNTGGRLKEK